jgi:hypothetical protein
MKNRAEIEAFLIHDMKSHGGCQSSWDWEADARFASFIEHKDAALINQACYSGTVWPIKERIIRGTGIIQLRLRYLRGLQKCGIVKGAWTGTGAGGLYELGTRRIRDYWLSDERAKLIELDQ